MRYLLLATDYDGTIASQGQVDENTMAALQSVLASGRKLVLVTGRHLPDLKQVFPHLELFHRVVAENGALLYRPQSRQEKLLCEPPPESFLARLQELKIPFSAGRGIVATWEPHQDAVLNVIRELGVELHVIFNKGAVMVLPSGVNKGTGLKIALDELGVSSHNVVGFGDAENDHAFLAACECAVAVGNALATVKTRADIVTCGTHGAGVAEVIGELLRDDLAQWDSRLQRHSITLGERVDDGGQPIRLVPHRTSVLVAGTSGSGKSTAVSGILEQLAEQKYQFCLIDPEGDYEDQPGALCLGSATERPDPRAVVKALEAPEQSIVISLLAIPVSDRPQYFSALLPRLQDVRARTARPHWLVVDEAHHMLPTSWVPSSPALSGALENMILVTVHPDHVSPAALQGVDVVVAIGKTPAQSLGSFAGALRLTPPQVGTTELSSGEALVWFRRNGAALVRIRTLPGQAERRRHLRQYAQGELSPEQSFYFRGPKGKLNLRAQNLGIFLQLAEGVDDATWMYHLKRGDYSRWFLEFIKDKELAGEAAQVEGQKGISARQSRQLIKEAVDKRYTAPA
ncbi:MAG TPA: HAD-IIB family hydrolase [Terriglobales bacterium]|nr:HAD-IIB family hydrolase [Terriglobales bacterium]